MHLRFKTYIDLTKKISKTNSIYVYDGKTYTFGKDQMFQAISEISDDNKTKAYGLDKKKFKIDISSFEDFLKEYKKNITDVKFDGSNYQIITDIPNISYTSEWTECDDTFFKETLDFFENIENTLSEEKCIFSQEMTKEQLEYFLTKKPIKIFLGRKTKKIFFEKPKDEKFLMIAILDSYLGKIVKASTVKLSVFGTKKIKTLKIEIVNGKFKSTYYGRFSTFSNRQEG